MQERVMLLLLDSPEFVASFLGAIRMGAIPIPTNTLLRPPDYEYLLNDSRATTLIVSEPLYANIEPLRANLKFLKHIIVAGKPREGTLHFDEWIADESSELAPAPTSDDDACFWLYSSGTTGFPKGALHSRHDMEYCAEHYARGVLNSNENDRAFSVAKLFFAYGLGNALYFHFTSARPRFCIQGHRRRKRCMKLSRAINPPFSFQCRRAMPRSSPYPTPKSSIRFVRCASA